MNSYLITGGTPETRLKKANWLLTSHIPHLSSPLTSHPHPDILTIEPSPSIGIAQIRKLKHFLSRKPHQADIKAVIIPEAEKLTAPAQNAFLKTLEEPPGHSIIILCCRSKEILLPTIISRCQIIMIPLISPIAPITQKTTHYLPAGRQGSLFTKILNSGAGEKLKLIEPYAKTRQNAIDFTRQMIFDLHRLLTSPNAPNLPNKPNLPNLPKIVSSLQKTINLLESNVNVKLCLDNLILSLPSKLATNEPNLPNNP